ncbi:hypothetical protein Bca52824_067958 [Brassica carinata]|uniref:NUC153 domain-containing protein n=1 Tax=Brassica carinata TaxID=52824 RepID=A0A8X7QPF2_BRACI|nr:hypothetical protein Bca52824_067958 [Brassica carinata]
MGSKRKKGEEGKQQMITDSRFSKAHTDPRFRSLPRRESKVTIDSRFKGVLTDKASAPVDKRGKRRRRGSAKDSLKEYYRIEEDDAKKNKKQKRKKEEEESESEGEEELMALEAEARRRKSEQSSEEVSDDEEETKSPLKLASDSDEESEEEEEEEEDGENVSEEIEEEDTDEDDEAMYEDDDGPEVAEEEIASIEKETHRLAIVNMDWKHVSAKDLYVVLNSFLPRDGRLLSVAVYPSEFGLERMKHEEIHGPAIGGDKKSDDDEEDDDEGEDKDAINETIRDYEKSKLRYYFGVAECDSSATADHLYKQCDGIEFERSSNKLDLRFIPDSMEFKHPPRDIATEVPATYHGLDFQSQALQMSKVNVSWDEDEPHRVRTLNQRFNPDQLAELELNEFLASDESESDSSDNDNDEEKRKEKYRALMESGDVDSDKDEDDEENDQDMVVEFNTGLEDLSNKFREKKEEKPETVWEAQLRKMREKKKARRMQKKDDDDDDSDDSSDGDDDEDDDYNVDHKKTKKKLMNKNKKGLEEKLAADEKSLAELELIVADENGKGLKGYNIKGKGKKKSKGMAEEKIPSADPDDSRFSAAFTDPNYALDPTNPQFKRSATYVKQLTQKQKEDPRSQEEQVKHVETKTTDGIVGSSKKRNFAESATVKSLKLKMQQKGSEKKKKEGTAELAQRVKNKAKALSNK